MQKNIKFSIWQKLVNDEVMRGGLINCVVEVPSEESYSQIKNIFNDTTDANMYLILETMAYSLNYIDDALYFSSKIEAINDKKVLQKEFLYKPYCFLFLLYYSLLLKKITFFYKPIPPSWDPAFFRFFLRIL